MKNWVCRKWYALIATFRKQWKSIVSNIFAIVGAFFTLAEIFNSVFKSSVGFEFIRNNAVLLSLGIFIICIILNWKPLCFTCFLKDRDTKITLLVDDIFKQEGAFVIPTNTTFDTLMEDEFISINSVQGQYQEKYYPRNLKALDREIAHALDGITYLEVQDGRTTNTRRYEIGTTCKISTQSRHAYFLAVADVNKYGKPENVTFDKITSALVCFWQKLNEFGHLENILMPIIGTGKAGIQDASRDKIIQEIIFSFIVAAREMKVTENLIICIHPKDFIQKNIHWDDLCEYLQYTCKYQYIENNVREGKAEENTVIARFG